MSKKKGDDYRPSDLEVALRKLKDMQDTLAESKIEVGTLRNDYLTDELMKFYALKGIFDGRVIKFFVERRKYNRIKDLRSIRKLVAIKKGNQNDK